MPDGCSRTGSAHAPCKHGPALNLIFVKDACAPACRDLRLVPVAARPMGEYSVVRFTKRPLDVSDSKETAMTTRRFKQTALARLLVGACTVIFVACALSEHAQAQPGYVPRYTPPPPPVFNPSNPTTVPQPAYKPITPTTPGVSPGYVVTSPVSEHLPRAATRSHRLASAAKTRTVHHRGHVAGITWPYYCGSSPCVRVVVAEPPPVYRASVLWWPGYGDYAPGQFGRGRPRWGGYGRPEG